MRWLARLLLLRVLPRRLLPILTIWEFWKIVRNRQAARARERQAELTPGPPPGTAARRPTTR